MNFSDRLKLAKRVDKWIADNGVKADAHGTICALVSFGLLTMPDWYLFEVGDIVSREGYDEHEILSFNSERDLMQVKCIRQDHCVGHESPTFDVGQEEWNLPRRYTFVRKKD